MSRLMRRGRREIPSLLNLARTPAALVEKVEAFSPRYSHAPLSARFYSTTLILPEATALPSPVMMILTTAEFATTTAPITQTPVPTSLAGSASATQTPTIAILPVASNTASLLENAATTGGDTGTPLPANVDPQNNTMVITVVAGIGESFCNYHHSAYRV